MRFGVAAHPMAVSLQCEQHSEGCEMGMSVMPVFVIVKVAAMMMMMMMMMTVPAMAAAAIHFRLAFIQREILAHTDIEFAHT
jgi:hypothetical protein